MDQIFNNYFFNPAGGKIQPDETLRGTLPGNIDIYSGKVDFSKSLKHDLKPDAGVKSSFVKTDNNALYENYAEGGWITDSAEATTLYTKKISTLRM